MATTPAEAKEKGNAAFKAAQYDVAIGHYTRAIVVSQSSSIPIDPTFYLNRAAAYLKLNKFEDAVRDCTSALGLKRGDVKALFRRAQARIGAEDEAGARRDLEEALRIEPSNEAVKLLLGTLKPKEPSKTKASSPLASAVKERTAPSTSKPARRRRIPITIVDSEPSTSKPAPKPLKSALKSPASTSVPSSSSSDLLTAVSSTRLTPSSQPATSSRADTDVTASMSTPVAPATFAAAREAREAKRTVGGGVFKKDGTGRIIGSDGGDLLSSQVVNGARDGVVERKSPAAATVPASAPSPAPTPAKRIQLPPPPQRASQFTMSLRDMPEEAKWPYLQLITADKLPAFFGSALEPDTLTAIIQILSSSSSPATPPVLPYLSALPKCKRFSTMRLFLPSSDTSQIKRMLDELGADAGLRKEWGV
ncbi:TPR-like protein [Calocera viscosa TUFC12733]|uniref:RNA polymerase II-associated protein 3 n=1 Tax=Calocera viscosa (strain TUFC12733) TaxID=1330018 RepID=A0A167RUY2_CALVF|nr:TPR-like protein [Calocera viscosa TUFC12733]